MRICVLGVGLIGGSVALAARGRLGASVGGWDPDKSSLADALDAGVLDDAIASFESLADADVVFCAGPVAALPGLVADALKYAGEQTVVTDVGSVKGPLAGIEDPRFVGGHPLAGAESGGVAHARADLFDGAVWYLTPSERTSGIKFERLHRLLASLGARPTAIAAAEHDHLMATVSHLPHVLANVMVERAVAGGALPPIGPSFRDATRVAGANPALWEEIYAANAAALGPEIDAVIATLRQVRAQLDGDGLGAWQREAAEHRARLLGTPSDGEPSELAVSVPNRPGVVAELALALGRANINIADMSLAPSADQATGLIRLYVSSTDIDRARELIAQIGLAVS